LQFSLDLEASLVFVHGYLDLYLLDSPNEKPYKK
jgi:hypothetical protein